MNYASWSFCQKCPTKNHPWQTWGRKGKKEDISKESLQKIEKALDLPIPYLLQLGCSI